MRKSRRSGRAGRGRLDPVPVSGRTAVLAGRRCERAVCEARDATHVLILTGGEWCAALIAEHLDETPPQGRSYTRAEIR